MGWNDILKKNVGKGYSATSFPALGKAAGAAKFAGTKALPVLKTAGAAAAPVLGRAASGMAAAGSAAQGALWGAGAATGASVLNAIADPGFVLFIAGLLTFFFNEYLGNVALAVLLGTVFMFYSSIFIFKARGIMVTVIFWVWYILFQGNRDPKAFLYMILPIIIIGMVVHGLVKKFQKGSFGEGASGEIIGAVPIILFFLDFGALDLLVTGFGLPLTPSVKNLILFTPWWALLGLFTTTKENFIISVFRIAGIVYIVAILTVGVVPDAYEKSQSDSLIPGPERFLEAKKELRETLPQKENPAYSNLVCIFSEPTSVPSCVEQRQENSELTYICEKVEGKEKGTPQFTQCLEEQKKKKKDAALQVQGAIDPTIKEPTKAEIIIDKDSFPTEFKPAFGFPFELKIENPREQQITAEVACRFESKEGEKKTVAGRIGGVNPATFNDASFQTSYLCYAAEGEELNGRYEIIFEATLKNLMTGSKLQRAFVGNVPADQIDLWRREEISKVIKNSESLAPAEFARINFNVGHGKKQIIIENDPQKSILVDGNIENVGSGKIVAVQNYQLSLEEFSVDNEPCRQGSLDIPNRTVTAIALPHCLITDYPEKLKNPPRGWEPYTFIATLTYDYQISKKENIEIKPLTS